MGPLHLAQIRKHLTTHFVPHLNLTGADQEHHQLSRALAALALAERTALPESTAAMSVTDDTLDGGIDGVAYAPDRTTLVLVQSKWTDTTAGISEGDVLKFINGVEKVVNNEWADFGGPIRERSTEIEDILSQPGTKLELVVVTSGTPQLATPQITALDHFCGRMNDATDIASWVYLNQERVYSIVASMGQGQVDLTINLRNWGSYQEADCVAYYGSATAQEVIKWYQDHGDLLFSRNIRAALTSTEVNDGIMSTAKTDPSRFWFFNNGITVIAESFAQAPHVNQKSANFTFTRASVVNGAQTVSALVQAAAQDPTLLESADVFVRFVTLDDTDGEFARLVTRRTNTQNRVGGREFVALDPQQERLRMEFAVSGLRYAYRAGETVSDPSKGCDLSEATVALACAYDIAETVLAKREIGRLWEDVSKAPYKALFNPSTSASGVWQAVEMRRWVDRTLDVERYNYEARDRLIVVHGNLLVLWAVMRHLKIKDAMKTDAFAMAFTQTDIEDVTRRATKILVELVNKGYRESYPQPLFKNQTKCRDVGDELLKRLAADD